MMNELQQYKIPLIFGAIGLVLAVLFVTIGFFKTLLILLLTGLGFALGLYLQRTGIIDEFFNQQ
ncbi:DUF2273 domain-containing protein [Enterococcus casseliflavus]|jgi:uncharacterized membrane protein|nr:MULTISPECIES: DUF2273 domain-containing protein [Enterococcus]AMG49151.1 DUF2273 domain-containing protein [Enterococcus gallinarum]EAA0412556.1 DUF2273 domain-containing protein [Listeria monocytogenes]EPH67990.1 hypothetical protein D931_00729 [Enterococcus faecium 13.SD.W.09]EPH97760.1 hypothetical protein D922_00089 [Enterococcus faecalis 06-MB-DW-09]ATF72015.1 DUF2273 domain-containing protein [Enterococcus sp. FDAARGOS_375]